MYFSEDSANAVCNVIEAVFLHGLKSSFSAKVCLPQALMSWATQHKYYVLPPIILESYAHAEKRHKQPRTQGHVPDDSN